MLEIIIGIVSAIIAIWLVNYLFKLAATILGGTIIYNVKIKLIGYILAWGVVASVIGSIFGF